MSKLFKNWEESIAGLALGVVFMATVWGVVARYVAPRPAAWTGEVATIGFAWIVFVGAAAGARRRLHIGVDLVTTLLPDVLQRFVAVLVALFLAVVLAYMAWLSLQLAIDSFDRPTAVIRLPSAVIYAAGVLGLGSMAAGSALDALRGFGERV